MRICLNIETEKQAAGKNITYTEFKDHDDSKNSPNRVATQILHGFFQENQKRYEHQSQTHFSRKDNFPRI